MTNLRTLAEQILAGDFSGLPKVEHEYWRWAQWAEAAQSALDGDDYSEVALMIAEELGWNEWHPLPERTKDEWFDFDSYFQANKTRFTAMVGKE